jgi:PadR family transcriptional regulator PadR
VPEYPFANLKKIETYMSNKRIHIYEEEKMKLVSRIEEIILLSIWRLQDNAYGITILEEVARATGKAWLTGSIYASLSRLLKRGLVASSEGDPTPERGGRRKIFYRLTSKGRETLLEIERIHSLAWSGLPDLEAKEK